MTLQLCASEDHSKLFPFRSMRLVQWTTMWCIGVPFLPAWVISGCWLLLYPGPFVWEPSGDWDYRTRLYSPQTRSRVSQGLIHHSLRFCISSWTPIMPVCIVMTRSTVCSADPFTAWQSISQTKGKPLFLLPSQLLTSPLLLSLLPTCPWGYNEASDGQIRPPPHESS